MKNIAIIGAGGFGREVKTIIDTINSLESIYHFLGFYDDGFKKGDIVNGFPVLGSVEDINLLDESCSIVIAIADPKTKQLIYKKITGHPKMSCYLCVILFIILWHLSYS